MTEEEFDGCLSRCRRTGKHTLKYPDCEFGERPKPTLDFFMVETADDGYPMGVIIPIPANVFLPWLDKLPVNKQFEVLGEIAKAKPEDRAFIVMYEESMAAGEL